MTTFTLEEIAAAAKLVPNQVDIGHFCFCEHGDNIRRKADKTLNLCQQPFTQSPHYIVGSVCGNLSATGLCKHHKDCHEIRVCAKGTTHFWQPWAATDIGRSEWAELDTAVRVWQYNSDIEGKKIPFNIEMLLNEMHIAARRPSLQFRQITTMAAAIEIGKLQGGSL